MECKGNRYTSHAVRYRILRSHSTHFCSSPCGPMLSHVHCVRGVFICAVSVAEWLLCWPLDIRHYPIGIWSVDEVMKELCMSMAIWQPVILSIQEQQWCFVYKKFYPSIKVKQNVHRRPIALVDQLTISILLMIIGGDNNHVITAV